MKRLVSLSVAILLALAFIVFELPASFEYRAQDRVFRRAGITHSSIVVLGIDDAALEMFGQWPWPRAYISELIHILNRYEHARPAVIALDILFSEPSRIPGDDDILASAVNSYDNILLPSTIRFGQDYLNPAVTAMGVDAPVAALGNAPHGLINAITDADGVVRNILLWENIRGNVYYSFSLAAALMYKNSEIPPVFAQENPYMFLRYTGEPGDFFGFSAGRILNGEINPAFFANKIVLIGPYAAGMRDLHHVPAGVQMHGVEIHANAVQAILDELFFRRSPVWLTHLIFLFVILFGMLIGETLDIRIVAAVFTAFACGYFFAARYAFFRLHWVFPVLTPTLLLAIIAVYQLVYGYVIQALDKNKLRRTFGKYVDPGLVDALIQSKETDSNAIGKKKHIAILFADVRGFTPLTESQRDTPEIIVKTLNEYLELTSTAVFNNGGSVDKFIGDATMALFNGFVPLEDYVYKAVKAADDMVRGASAVNASLKERLGIDIGFGVGVHCGDVIVGNLGPSFRKDYTAIGDPVNTASRLESHAERSQILISRDVFDLLRGRIKAESIGEIPLKGKNIPMEVFKLTEVL
ncbi:MAG: adenylate/guanylate cyclase domain-containing protein [Defluviitaleaceae bacterium]|nr:adenylate/guanylate cyclase domain-containing protein [Defluviitaleaceae bacterium]